MLRSDRSSKKNNGYLRAQCIMIGEYIAAIHFHLTSKPFFCRLVVCPLYTCYTSIHMEMSHTSDGSALSLSLSKRAIHPLTSMLISWPLSLRHDPKTPKPQSSDVNDTAVCNASLWRYCLADTSQR
jgi:hypothetical protein